MEMKIIRAMRLIKRVSSYYINQKLMKKKVKTVEVGGFERRYVLKDFSRMLDNEIGWIVVARSADWKPVPFLSFACAYRIFEKLKAFELRVSRSNFGWNGRRNKSGTKAGGRRKGDEHEILNKIKPIIKSTHRIIYRIGYLDCVEPSMW